MESGNPIWWTVAVIISGCMALLGLGVLFVRAKHIERRWVVALPTLFAAMFAIYLLSIQPVWAGGADTTLPLVATIISILGFAIGRLVDYTLGPLDTVKRDQATYNADLAD